MARGTRAPEKPKRTLMSEAQRVRTPSVADLAQDFLHDHARRRSITAQTELFYKEALGWYVRFAEERGLTVEQMTHKTAEEYTAWLMRKRFRGRPLSNTTIHQRQRMLRTFSRWLRKQGHLRADITEDLELVRKNMDTSPQCLSEPDLGKVLDVPDLRTIKGIRAYCIVYLLAATGLRHGELRGLRRSDLLDEERRIRVRAEVSKSRRERYVFLPEVEVHGVLQVPDEISVPLAEWLAWRVANGFGDDDPLFVEFTGAPLSKGGLVQMMRRIGKAAGVHLTARVLRHTAAVRLLNASGGNLKLVYDVLGHSSMEVTKQYLRFTPDDVQRLHRQANPMATVPIPKQFRRGARISLRDVRRALTRAGIDEKKLVEGIFGKPRRR